MKRALFYCPMNPPQTGGPPSGDRAMARLLTQALAMAGFGAKPASRLRSYEGAGDAIRQNEIARAAAGEVDRLVAVHRMDRPALWLTYMNYHKSPDYLGPAISQALRIPYLIVEASHAAKRAHGDFAAPYAAAKIALRAASAVCCMTDHDRPGLAQIVPADRLFMLRPFIDAPRFTARNHGPGEPHRILSVAMLRPGKKLANFDLIAPALEQILDLDWRYVIAGDGPGRAVVEAALARLPAERVQFLGRVEPSTMPATYGGATLYLWPGLREAYGLSYLEAEASGLPVVACATHGVPAVVQHGRTGLLSATGDAEALAASLRALLTDETHRQTLGRQAADFVRTDRTIAHAAGNLRSILTAIGA